MKLDGFAVQYYLSREFDDVASEGITRNEMFDYPMLYDVSIDMTGHVVLVPAHERPSTDRDMSQTLCVCVGEEAASSARKAGASTVLIRGDVVFQHLYNRMQRIFVANERYDAQLHALVDNYAGFQPLLDVCANFAGHPCALIDEQYRLVCKASPGIASKIPIRDGEKKPEAFEPDTIDLFMASPEYHYLRSSKSVFTLPNSSNLMMKNVFSKGELVGSLVIEHLGDALGTRYVRFLLNYLTSFIEDAYGRIGSFGISSVGAGLVKAALQDALNGDVGGYGDLETALVESGHKRDCDYVVLRIERSFTNEGAEEREYLAHRLEMSWPFAYCFVYEDALFALADVSDGALGAGKDFAKELPLVARENLVKVGASRTFNDIRKIDVAIAQAGIALKYGSEIDPMNWRYRFGDYAFTWLVSRALGDMPPEFVYHPAITVLLRYDESHGTDLLNTLSTFIRCRYNATTTSNELFVARSTLLHRLDRIDKLVKINFDNASEMTYISLSLAMMSHL